MQSYKDMPLILPHKLPAIEQLRREENILVDCCGSASGQTEVRPLRVAVLNLMPLKEATETDLVRVLSNTPLAVELTFMKLGSHVPKHTSAEHMAAFYTDFAHLRNQHFDGLIVTGAPVELIDFEQVTYWPELTDIFDWARENVASTLYICWAAQAGLYHFYGIPKYRLERKMFGVFAHRALVPEYPIFRGFDDVFYVPHSRHTEVRESDIRQVADLTLLSVSEAAGVHLVMAGNGREFFVTGHSEYSPLTLDSEYRRDLGKGLPIDKPCGYYVEDDSDKGVLVRWRAHANLLYANWLHCFVARKIVCRTEA